MNLQEKMIGARKKKGVTQDQLARELQVTRQTVSRWERGTALPSMDNLRRLSHLYGVPLDYFVDGKEDSLVTQEQKGRNGHEENFVQKEENESAVSDKEKTQSSLGKYARNRRVIMISVGIVLVICVLSALVIVCVQMYSENSKNTISYSDMEDASKDTSSGSTFSLEW